MGHKRRSHHSSEENHIETKSEVDFQNSENESGKEKKKRSKKKNYLSDDELTNVKLNKNNQVSHDKTLGGIDDHDSPSMITIVSKKKKKKMQAQIQSFESDDNKDQEEKSEIKSKKSKEEKLCENSVTIKIVTKNETCNDLSQVSNCEESKHKKKKKKQKKQRELSGKKSSENDSSVTSLSISASSSASDDIMNNKTSDKKRKHDEGLEIIDRLVSVAEKKYKKSKNFCELRSPEQSKNVAQSSNVEEVADCVRKHKKHSKTVNIEDISSKVDELINKQNDLVQKRKKSKKSHPELVQSFVNVFTDDRFDKVEPSKKRRNHENNEQVRNIYVTDEKMHSKKTKVKMSPVSQSPSETSVVLENEVAVSQAVSRTTPKVPNLGQWKDASIDGDERKLKFFRLLGGFKDSGASSSTDIACANHSGNGSKFSSMAMQKSEVNKLNAVLEGQFERARNLMFNQQRGVGLGFAQAPDAGKKFHIDTMVTKSKKFCD